MIILIHPNMELWDFIIDGVRNRYDFFDSPLDRFTTRIQIMIRKLFPTKDLPAWFIFNGDIRQKLRLLGPADKVIISAYTDPTLFFAVRRCVNTDVGIHLWMWNPIKSNSKFHKNIQLLKRNGFSLHSFDVDDCVRMGMTYHRSFYNMAAKIESSESKYDFYFLGAPKDREEAINEIRILLQNYKTHFVIPSKATDFITYHQNLLNILASKCIVEVLQKQQHDITLRPLEAIAFKRKLLTNNRAIRDYSFYNSNNIFIVGEDDPASLDHFLKSPFQDIPEDVIREYDVNHWIDSF